MATNSNDSRGEQAMNVREITSGLSNELKLRNDPSAVGPSCASPLMRTTSEEKPTPLLDSLKKVYQETKTKTSPRNGNSSAGLGLPRSYNSFSPSPSASSDSSMSGGVSARIVTTSRNKEKIPYRTVSVPNISPTQAGPSRQVPIFGLARTGNGIAAGRGSGNVNVAVRNAQMCTSTVGRGKSLVPPPQTTGSAPMLKEKKKRKRLSKKPPTQIIETSPDRFRDTVQGLTGMKTTVATPVGNQLHTVEVVRPQPVRTQPIVVSDVVVPINIDNDRQNLQARPEARPEAGLESSSPAMGSSVRCASPIALDPAPVSIISYRDHSSSSGTSSGKSSLNYTMGFEQDQFPFLEDHQLEHRNPPDYSGLPEEEFDYEDPTPYENRTRAAVSTRSTFQGPEGNRKEEISNGLERPSGSNSGFGCGSAMPDHSRPSPSEGLERSNRPPNVDHLQMEEDDYLMVAELWTDSSWIDHYT